jgi:DNA (cytosine-5)-methyltransferase 1
MYSSLTCVESFCGAGGMSLGIQKAGFDVKLAFDLNEFAVSTYLNSIAPHCIVADASKLSAEEIKERTGLAKGELSLFSGGPPCQGFSKQRRGAHIFEDSRNLLIKDYVNFVKALEPKAFILENVAIFGQIRGKAHLDELAEILCDYNLYPCFYNAADYGLAQKRQRFVLVGMSKAFKSIYIKPSPTVSRWKTVGEVIGDLPEPPEDCSVHSEYFNHQRARVTAVNIERFSHVPQGGGWQDIPYELRLPCHKKVDVGSGGWPDVYGRLKWDGQCPTITGGFDSFTRGRYGHPLKNRPLTPREAARLQGFPDYVHFQGPRQEVRYQIGNAVPPPLAAAISNQVKRILLNDNILFDEIEWPAIKRAVLSR